MEYYKSQLYNSSMLSISGLDDGGQIVAPGQTSTNSELSVPSSEMLLELQLQLQVATVREVFHLSQSFSVQSFSFGLIMYVGLFMGSFWRDLQSMSSCNCRTFC